ncbi:MAG: ATP-binding protein [Phormidesmis sp.]
MAQDNTQNNAQTAQADGVNAFVGGGEVGALMRSHDWSQTALGPIAQWPQPLRTTTSLCLTSHCPIIVTWGQSLATLYNDAALPILGIKHPSALGHSARDCWHEIWDAIGPDIEKVLANGTSAWSQNQQLIINRKGFLEEGYFSFSHSPIFDTGIATAGGSVEGIFTTITETTRSIIGDRQLITLQALASCAVRDTIEDVCQSSIQALSQNDYDIPFALIYTVDSQSQQAQLVAATENLTPEQRGPEQIDLTQLTDPWQLGQVNLNGQPKLIENLSEQADRLPTGAWPVSPQATVVRPLVQSSSSRLTDDPASDLPDSPSFGFLVMGLNPYQALDDDYCRFIDLVVSQITATLSEVKARIIRRSQATENTLIQRQMREEIVSYEQATAGVQTQINTILESISDAFVSFDNQWRYTYVNGQAASLLNKTRDELLGKQVWQEVFPEAVNTSRYHSLQQALREQETVVFEDYVSYLGRWLEISAYPSAEGLSVYFRDISDRKAAEAEREQLLHREQRARAAAENANRVKDEFLAVISHELRTPLNPILGWASLLRRSDLGNDRQERALEAIERNAKAQAQLINDLLDVSRILRGQLSLNHQALDPTPLIQAAIETAQLAADAKEITIQTQFEPNAGKVAADPSRLQQIIWNLLANAVKFTPAGGEVTVSLVPAGNHLQIAVSDNGKGIHADFLPFVFDRFYQEDTATTRRFGGLGLGLAIVRYLSELHGGTVQVTSAGENQGSTFTVSLPVTARLSSAASSPLTSQHRPSNLSGLHILVVDEDDSSLELLTFLLGHSGATVTAKSSGLKAIATLSEGLPDIIISAIAMPEMDGYKLMQQMKAVSESQGKEIPAIALTAYASELNHKKAISAGFKRHIAKPIEPDNLLKTVISLANQTVDCAM